PLQVGAECPAGAEPPADSTDDLRADRVVPDEGDVAGAIRTRLRLTEVVEECAEAERVTPSELVGERLRQELGDLGRLISVECGQVALDSEPLFEHSQRVTE